jgi:formamidopyrimidine-DNA glycosylase
VVLHYTDGTRLSFADVRTFGRMRLVQPDEAWDADLGIEPLSSGFTPQGFIGMLSGRTTPIKTLLLDQRHIAGIGNIYASEALWEAGIRPGKPANALTKPATLRLYHAIRDVLTRATEMRGSSVDDYVDAEGLRGGFQNVLSVYGKLGDPCPRCGKPIVRTVIAQRGTWWCRNCQR